MLERAGINKNSLDIASLAQMLLGNGTEELSDFEKTILEKALTEKAAVEAVLAGKFSESELHESLQSEQLLRAQQEALFQAQLQQEALV